MINPRRTYLLIWLTLCVLLVAMTVIVGGLTRLSESGLSIVEWQPFSGVLPPLTDAAWQEEFSKYQASPQYEQVNAGMSLADFKNIFWLEYWHRLLGRVIGAVFLLPFLYALHKRYVPAAMQPRLWLTFALGGIQGGIGWWMVSSGLIDEPRVSPYLLAFHLGMAFVILGLLFWSVLDVWNPPLTKLSCRRMTASGLNEKPDPGIRRGNNIRGFAWAFTALLFLQILLGALVAGLDAGLTYNTWPLMDGRWIPEGLALLTPPWRNVFENITAVQFEHRMAALLLVFVFPGFLLLLYRNVTDALARRLAVFTALALLLQFVLGIATVLSVVAVPLASAHQGGALMLFALMITLNHRLAQLSATR